jgi:hypothetical protein
MVLGAMREHRLNAPQSALLTMRSGDLARSTALILRSPPEAGVSKDGLRRDHAVSHGFAHGFFAMRGSSASRRPSPTRFTASTVTERNAAGKNTM